MTENKEALDLRKRLRPVAEKHAGEMLRDLIGPASNTAHRVATDHLLSFAQTVATPPAQDAMREALEKICIHSNRDWSEARRNLNATMDRIHSLAVDAYYGTASLSTPQPESVDDEATTYKIAEYAGKSSDLVMIWANDRNLRKGGYCLECVPRDIAPSIISALTSAQSSTVKDDLTIALAEAIEALNDCRVQFEYYTNNHRVAGKFDKAATNQQFADMIAQVVAKHGEGL